MEKMKKRLDKKMNNCYNEFMIFNKSRIDVYKKHYTYKWKPFILERDKCKCRNCEDNKVLTLSHITSVKTFVTCLDISVKDSVKFSYRDDNLIILCKRCHYCNHLYKGDLFGYLFYDWLKDKNKFYVVDKVENNLNYISKGYKYPISDCMKKAFEVENLFNKLKKKRGWFSLTELFLLLAEFDMDIKKGGDKNDK